MESTTTAKLIQTWQRIVLGGHKVHVEHAGSAGHE
jgi:hypothetical protein